MNRMAQLILSVEISRMRPCNRRLVAAILMVTSTVAAAAARAEEDCVPRLFSARPGAGIEPTLVLVSMYLLDISEIDDRDQTFRAEFYFGARWRDARLARGTAAENVCTFDLVDVWNPRLRLLNQREVAKRFADVVSVDSSGNVSYEQRFAGVFTAPGDVSAFPFDRRQLAVSMMASGFTENDISISFEEGRFGRRDFFSVANWSISDAEVDVSSIQLLEDANFTRARIAVQATRMSRYYIWNALVPLMMIVFMSWGVFWINPSNIGPQIGLAATSMLTLIAYRFTLANVLPPVAYLTRMDMLLIALSGLVLLAFFEAITVGSIADRGRSELAGRIQALARILFPAALLVSLLVFFAS
jgi:hypothetical protein